MDVLDDLDGAVFVLTYGRWIALCVLVTIITLRKCYYARRRRSGRSWHLVHNEDAALEELEAQRELRNKMNKAYASSPAPLSPPPPRSASQESLVSRRDEVAEEQGFNDRDDEENDCPVFSCREIFRDWGIVFSLGLPGALSLLVEWGSFEVVSTIAGRCVWGWVCVQRLQRQPG